MFLVRKKLMLLRYHNRLRQVDVKAEHFERQVQRLEQERDQWEKKYEVRLNLKSCLSINLTNLHNRMRKKNTSNRRKSSTNLCTQWRAFNSSYPLMMCVSISVRYALS